MSKKSRRGRAGVLPGDGQLRCQCGSPAVLRSAEGLCRTHRPGAMAYVCSRYPACDSYVGTHKKDRSPLGTPANKSLRHKRILAHRSLDAVQHRFQMQKWEAYVWLQAKLGLSESETHIGMFSEYMCDRTIALCNQALEAAHIRAA